MTANVALCLVPFPQVERSEKNPWVLLGELDFGSDVACLFLWCPFHKTPGCLIFCSDTEWGRE